jgi:hypothetical protein
MRDQIINALKMQYAGMMEMHRANIDIYLANPVGIGEHPDILGAIDSEIAELAAVTEKLQTLMNEFDDDPED